MQQGSAIAAATSAVAGVAALVGKVGNIFTKGKEVKQQAESLFKKPRQVPNFPVQNFTPSVPRTPTRTSFNNSAVSRNNLLPQQRNNAIATAQRLSFFQKHKTPILVGTGLLVVGTGVYIAMRSKKKKPSRAISGVPKRSTRRKKSGYPKRDELGRFTKRNGTQTRNKRSRKAPEKLVPKALL